MRAPENRVSSSLKKNISPSFEEAQQIHPQGPGGGRTGTSSMKGSLEGCF